MHWDVPPETVTDPVGVPTAGGAAAALTLMVIASPETEGDGDVELIVNVLPPRTW